MPGLQKQLVPVPLGGLQTKVDPKGAPVGLLTTAENVFATRRAGSGVEMRKRLGFTSLTKSIQGGGSIATGRWLAPFNDELVLCDALAAYSYSATLAKWISIGRAQSITADLARISGNEGTDKINADVAYAAGYACFVSSPDSATAASTVAKIYIQDIATGDIIAQKSFPSAVYRCRVLTLGNAFYVFSWSGAPGHLQCQKIDTATPATFGALTDVATNLHSTGVFDVTVDSTNARMVVAYRNTTPNLTLMIWTTGMSAGTSVAYASADPTLCVGFLVHDFSDGFGYLGLGGATYDIHLIKFGATNMTVPGGGDTTVDAGGGTDSPFQISGYRSTVNNLFWTASGNVSGLGHNAHIKGWSNGVAFDVMRSVGLASRPFKIGAKWYVMAGYQSSAITDFARTTGQQRLFMIEMDQDTTGGAGAVSIAGYLMASDAAGGPLSRSCLPSAVKPTATTALFAACGINAVAPDNATASEQHHALVKVSLDWSGAGLGRPVAYNGVLHIPSAAARIYDGFSLTENGFYVNPEAPVNAAQTTAGSLTLLGVYQYCVVWARTDKQGRLWRSAPGPVTTVTLTGANNKVNIDVPCLRVTDASPTYNVNQQVTAPFMELYRTQNGLPNFYLCSKFTNQTSSDAATFTDAMSDDDLIKNELLYTTGGVLDHISPPAVKVYHRHAGRLFAITGDESLWHSKETVEGDGAQFSDDLRFTIGDGQGKPTAMGTVDSTAVIFKRNRTYLVSGPGPDEFGNNEFPAPQPLNIDAGATGPGGVTEISTGLLVRNPKDWYTLSRSLEMQPVEAPAAFSANVPAFGTQLDGYPIVVIPTQAEALVYDWQFGQWYDWTGASSYLAGVMSARYGTALAILQSDGTVKVQGAAYNDDSAAIATKVEGAWINLTRARLYKVITTADWLASTTLSETISYDFDSATAATKTIAVTTGTKGPVVMQPNRGRASVVKLLVQESSTTAGVALTGLDLEVGIKSGAEKHRAGQYMT